MRRKGHLLDLIAIAGLAVLIVQFRKVTLSDSGVEFGQQFDPWLFRGGFLVTGFATLAVIAAITHRGAYANGLLGNPLFNWIGTRSYGLYLFHWPIYQVIRKSTGINLTFAQFVLAMAITVPITELSYRFVEMPIRRGHFRLWSRTPAAPRPGRGVRSRRRIALGVALSSTLLGFAGVSLAVARNVCVGAVECSLTASEPDPEDVTIPTATTVTVDSTPATSTTVADPSATVSPVAPVETTTTVAETTTTPAPPPQSAPIALGESVMLGAKDRLEAGGFYVDAQKSRQGTDMAALVEGMRAFGQLGSVVVIQIGTNGSVSPETFAQIMAQLPPDLTPQVVFLTVHVPKRWQDGNNAIIRDLPNHYANVAVLDWDSAAQTVSICSDGTHIACGPEMAQFYANLIFGAIGRPDLQR